MKVVLIVWSIFFLWGLISCIEPTAPTTSQRLSDSVDTFPLSVGLSWTYAFHDSDRTKTDTIHIQITREDRLDSSTSSLLSVISSSTFFDSMLITVRGDTIDFHPYTFPLLTDARFVLPITAEKTWESRSYSYRVVGVDTLTDGDEHYFRAIRVTQFGGGGFNCIEYNTYWIADTVGIVKITMDTFCTIGRRHHYRTWQLLHHLPSHVRVPAPNMQNNVVRIKAK